ncbi:hypothetical protein [Zunongwangia sp. HGR-M22]|uniref:hypothetical protein n=1 Tax=Zunongwangia sp. HGR-M22 TaxID=3015168 RepID=UPI0022DDB47C|nr:hypothetical protein [Zunongwangia sp. HGR-M22]WBL24129.1 hypothetical protein PBT91_09285 [Zunongwangia sp. HGR-M22]
MEALQTNPGRNLETYRILFIIKAVLNLAFTLFGLIYIIIGFVIPSQAMPDHFFNLFNVVFFIAGGVFILLSIILAVITFLAAKYLKERKNWSFIVAVSVVNCLTGVLGIVLGILTIIELQKPEVRAIFDTSKFKE